MSLANSPSAASCWTVGYFIGLLLGGWAMDQSALVARRFWLGVGLSATVCIGLLWVFEAMRMQLSPVAETPNPELSVDSS